MTQTDGPLDPAETSPVQADYLSGLCLGAAIGGLIGLSASALGTELLSGLIALLVVFSALAEKFQASEHLKCALRHVLFGLIVFLPLGVMTRTHAWLGPTFAEKVASYKVGGVSEERATALAIFDQTGLKTGSLADAAEPAPLRPENAPFAFSAATKASVLLCSTLFLIRRNNAWKPWRALIRLGIESEPLASHYPPMNKVGLRLYPRNALFGGKLRCQVSNQ